MITTLFDWIEDNEITKSFSDNTGEYIPKIFLDNKSIYFNSASINSESQNNELIWFWI